MASATLNDSFAKASGAITPSADSAFIWLSMNPYIAFKAAFS